MGVLFVNNKRIFLIFLKLSQFNDVTNNSIYINK